MAEFITPDKEEFVKRLVVMVYAKAGIGKTTLAYRLAKSGNIVFLISTDKGTIEASLDPSQFKNRLAIAKPKAGKDTTYIQSLRDTIDGVAGRIEALSKKKIPPSKIWVVVDTATQMQADLMTEARKIDIKHPGARSNRDEFVRDITTQIDYGINLAMMNEVMSSLMDLPCNLYITAYEKEDKDSSKGNRAYYKPQLSGQARDRFEGAADVICRLEVGEEGERLLKCNPTAVIYAKNRGGKLNDVEEPDLAKLWNKVFAEPKPIATPTVASQTETTESKTTESNKENSNG